MPDGADRLVGGWPFTANPPLGTGAEASAGAFENVMAYEDDPFLTTERIVKPAWPAGATAAGEGFFFWDDRGGWNHQHLKLLKNE